MRIEHPAQVSRLSLVGFSGLLLVSSIGPTMAGDAIYGYTDTAGVTHLTNISSDGPYRLVLRNPENYRLKDRPEYRLAAPRVAPEGVAGVPPPYDEEVKLSARAFGLDPALLHAVIKVESNYNAAALSPKGAVGLMQLMPGTSERFGVVDPLRPQDNIRGGALYLSQLLALFDQDLNLALAAYNAGEQSVIRYGRRVPPYRETLDYVDRVVGLYRRLSTSANPAPVAQTRRSGRSG